MFRLVNRLLRSAIATARRILDGLSCMVPNPAFCAASDMARGDGDAVNRAGSWRCLGDADAEKLADRGLTKLPRGIEDGDAENGDCDAVNGDCDAEKAVNPRDAPGERSAMFLGERAPRAMLLGECAPKAMLARGDGDPKVMLPRGEGGGRVMLLRGEGPDANDAWGDSDARDMLPKEDNDDMGSA